MPHPLASPAGRQVNARDLEEVKFWLEIMREHASTIKNGLSAAHTDLISEADEFYRCFGQLLAKANRVNGEKRYNELINDSILLVRKFYRFKRRLLRLSLTGRLQGALYPLQLDHISREALYFLYILQRIKNKHSAFHKVSMVREMLFWLRIMSDHAKFVAHLLDPSERGLIEAATDFAAEFDTLYLQGRDFASMLGIQGNVPSFDRFILDVRAATVRLRDFLRALTVMLEEKRAIGILSPGLVNHFLEETDHFLMVLAMMEKGLIETNEAEACLDLIGGEILAEEEDEGVGLALESDECTEDPVCDTCTTDTSDCTDTTDTTEDGEEDTDAVAALEAPTATDDAELPPIPKLNPNSKYKWSGKWPRPLGKS